MSLCDCLTRSYKLTRSIQRIHVVKSQAHCIHLAKNALWSVRTHALQAEIHIARFASYAMRIFTGFGNLYQKNVNAFVIICRLEHLPEYLLNALSFFIGVCVCMWNKNPNLSTNVWLINYVVVVLVANNN